MPNPIAILIVEDQVLIAPDLREILEEVGYDKIHKARNYQQAIELIKTPNFDLILLDIKLNDQHFQVESVKSNEIKIQGVVILISRNTQNEVLRMS